MIDHTALLQALKDSLGRLSMGRGTSRITRRPDRGGVLGWVDAATGLHATLLIRADHERAAGQQHSLPCAGAEIRDAGRLDGEVLDAGKRARIVLAAVGAANAAIARDLAVAEAHPGIRLRHMYLTLSGRSGHMFT